MANSEQLLSVQIQHFENVFNAEIRGGQYCCCDQTMPPCNDTIMALSTTACNTACHPYFMIYFQPCPSIETCCFAKLYNFPGDFIAATSSFVIQTPFSQSELETYNQVRI